jgi:hypothetical protein
MNSDHYKFKKQIGKFEFCAPSIHKPNAKYDVYWEDEKGKQHTSFGDKNYGQYKDLIGYYKNDDNLDLRRKISYRKRHQHDILNEYTPGFFSWFFLW